MFRFSRFFLISPFRDFSLLLSFTANFSILGTMIFEIFEVGIWYVAKYECESLLCTPPKQEVDVEFSLRFEMELWTYRCIQKFNDIGIWIFCIPAKKERKYSKIQGILSSYPPQFSFRDRSKGEENSVWKPPTTNPSWKRKVVPKQGRERKEKKGLWEGGAVWNIVSLFANPDKSPSTGFLEVPRAYRSRASAHPRFLSALSFIGKNPFCPIPARRLCVWPPPPPLCFGPCATLDRRNVGIFRGQGRRGGCLNRARRGYTRGELGEFDFVSSF